MKYKDINPILMELAEEGRIKNIRQHGDIGKLNLHAQQDTMSMKMNFNYLFRIVLRNSMRPDDMGELFIEDFDLPVG